MMHKRVYNDVARIIRTQKHQIKHLQDVKMVGVSPEELNGRMMQIDVFMIHLSDLFQNDNSQFNAEKFMKACEIDTESK